MKSKRNLLLLCVFLCVHGTILKAGGRRAKGKADERQATRSEMFNVSPASLENPFDRLPDELVEKILFYVCVDTKEVQSLEGIQCFSAPLFTEGRVPLKPDTLAVRSVCTRFHSIIGSVPLARAYFNTFCEPCSQDVLYPAFNVRANQGTFLYLCVEDPTIDQQTSFQIKDAGTAAYPFDVAGQEGIKRLHAISLSRPHADRVTHISVDTKEQLSFLQSSDPLNLSFLQYFPRLTHLEIDCEKIQDLAFLSSCETLKKLSLLGHEGAVEALEPIFLLPHLEDLTLCDFRCLEGLTFFQNNTVIRSLGLYRCEGLQTLSGIDKLLTLQALYLQCCESLQGLSALQSCSSLQKLELSSEVYGLSVLSHLTQLKDITLSSDQQLESFRKHNKSKGLESLRLLCCNQLSDLGFLKQFPTLKRLVFRGRNLESVSGVEQCPDLKELDLTFCRKLCLQGLDALKDCSQLEKLVLPRAVHGDDRSIKNHFFPNVSFLYHNGGFTVKEEQIRFLQKQLRELPKEAAAGSTSSS